MDFPREGLSVAGSGEKPLVEQGSETPPSDDEMIGQFNPHHLSDSDEDLSHLEIAGGWNGISGRVVVGQNETVSPMPDRQMEHLSRMEQELSERPL